MLAACYCQRRRSKQILKKNTDTRLYLCGIRHYALITSSLVILCFRYSVFLFEFTIIFCLLVNVPRVVKSQIAGLIRLISTDVGLWVCSAQNVYCN